MVRRGGARRVRGCRELLSWTSTGCGPRGTRTVGGGDRGAAGTVGRWSSGPGTLPLRIGGGSSSRVRWGRARLPGDGAAHLRRRLRASLLRPASVPACDPGRGRRWYAGIPGESRLCRQPPGLGIGMLRGAVDVAYGKSPGLAATRWQCQLRLRRPKICTVRLRTRPESLGSRGPAPRQT